jgi:hypothetical protein
MILEVSENRIVSEEIVVTDSPVLLGVLKVLFVVGRF